MTICRRINGGTNGLRDQKLYLARAKAALAAPPASVEPTPAAPMPREEIRALQQQLAALGYHMVGKADGLIGSSTVAAVSAFQHDKDLPLTGEFDAATLAAIWSSDESRPLPASRAKGAPDASPVLASAIQLKAGSTLAATGGLAAWGAGALNQAEAAKDTWGRVQALAEPFASLRETLAGHPVLIVVSVAMVVGMVASRIAQTTIADYRSGRAP
ncbi:MAG TPA: peptidoglycan-binding domain-containing protein [Beijerinckiaceae bacterium]|nr:peptidoglycan-binding domain-containing protein [Beijerinckiaceae bacterium]